MANYEVLKTSEIEDWLELLPPKTKTIVLARFDMISIGHFGDHKRFEGLLEFRGKMALAFTVSFGPQA